MQIDDKLIDSLLYGEEGVDLDFKEGQYRFSKASDEKKVNSLKIYLPLRMLGGEVMHLYF